MNIFLLLLIILILYKIKYIKKFNNEYLSKESTTCINGIFVLLVFFSHILMYCQFTNNSSFIYEFIHVRMEQLIVTSFLFYSGYGIFESVQRKKNYVKEMPKKRILKLLVMFWIAIILFLITNLILNINYDLKTILLSFTGWTSIGNSNWYIFSILSMYLFTYISCIIFKKDKKVAFSVLFLSIIYIIYLKQFKFDYWYNTIICFPFGMLLSVYKEKIKKILTENRYNYYLFLTTLSILFFISYKCHKINPFFYEAWALSFISIITLITIKFKIFNKILFFFGKYVFWIYILQRLPMIILQHYNLQLKSSYLFFVLCFLITIILAIFINYAFSKLYNKYSNKKIRN